MARKERMSQEKKEVIGNLIEMYSIKTTKDIQDALKDLLGDTLQEMLEAELSEELGYEKYEGTKEPKRNYRNGYKTKRVKSSAGEVELQIPQDRNSEFEPKVVPRYKRDISEIEQEIIYMYRDRKISARTLYVRVFRVAKNHEAEE